MPRKLLGEIKTESLADPQKISLAGLVATRSTSLIQTPTSDWVSVVEHLYHSIK